MLQIETISATWQMAGIVAEVVLAGAAVVGLGALFLTKKDMITRSKRDAIATAIAQCEYFGDRLIPEQGAVMASLTAAGVKLFYSEVEGPLKFDPTNRAELAKAQAWVKTLGGDLHNRCFTLLNHLEAFSMFFTTRLGDGEVAFGPISDIYCRTVGLMYPVILERRSSQNPEIYPNVVKLYDQWAGRKTEKQLEREMDGLIQRRLALGDVRKDRGKPLGTE
jgi:hypothetical protein